MSTERTPREKELEDAIYFAYQKADEAMSWMIETCRGMAATRPSIDVNWAVTFEKTKAIRKELDEMYGTLYRQIRQDKFESDLKTFNEQSRTLNKQIVGLT